MKKSSLPVVCSLLFGMFLFLNLASAQNDKRLELPKPRMYGGKPLMEALKERHSSREFSPEKLKMQVLSDMLWAAWGINRPDSGKRTAPSTANRQVIDIYIATSDGLYFYDAKEHMLTRVFEKDLRSITGRASFTKDAPVNLIYVADLSRFGGLNDEQEIFLPAADTGFISQNVYLYCASEGLATVVYHSIDKPSLEEAMGLRPDQRITLAQSVGYPKE